MDTSTSPMTQIEELTRTYSKDRQLLSDRMSQLDAELTAVKRRRLRGIRSALGKAQESGSKLESAITRHPELFEKPRTVTIDGIKVGLAKGKGQILWDNKEKVVKAIERHFPDQAEVLLKTTRTPVKKALTNLSTAQLKAIGCRVIDTGDQVVIKPADGELDKLISRLLEEASDSDMTEDE